MSVEVKALSKRFGKQTAVDQISFKTEKGKILGFLGPNGAGKTTTMKMICGFLPATSGQILVCGSDILENPVHTKAKIGYLPENNPLYKDMYVREFLMFFGNLCKLKNLKSRLDDLISMTGLEKEYKKQISSLSKGYRQRVGLCQALIHDPEVLILDEPTSGLDPNQLVDIRQLIMNIGKEKTLIFSSHIMQEVQALCDRVLILNQGKIVADEPIQSLLTRTNSARIIYLEFANEISIHALNNIAFIEKTENLGNGKFKVWCTKDGDPREDLFKLAMSNQWTIREMREEKSSIEDVFNLLTKSSGDVGSV
ncbi:MAG: gliding motility-associated ABC transporter ATP-binding subunit GldA [Saprospiraceae bacterium]|nr:gliding motility-associated ABC transporter ATP-binding subunit GldA [Saprospiraceae bacterium]